MYSNNVAGLKSKAESLKNVVRSLNVAIFTIQETHFVRKGKFSMIDFEIFEAIRSKDKGGTLIGINKSLNPVEIAKYEDEFELLSVEFKMGKKEMVIISGYGPQESWPEANRIPFFTALEKEVARAELLGKSVIIQMDSNSKLGSGYIPGDPHLQSTNGKILAGIIDRHGLIVANGIPGKYEGSITRRRSTKDNIEESIIDHVIISEDLVNDLDTIVVDEKGINALEKHHTNGNAICSDHNPIISKFKFKWNKKVKVPRIEIFNLKDKEGQKRFKEATNTGTYLSDAFEDASLDKSTDVFIERLNNTISHCFKKIRIVDRPDKAVEELFRKRKILRQKVDDQSKAELKDVEIELNNRCAESNYKKIKEELMNIKPDEGGLHHGHLWNLKKKLCSKSRDPPSAMLNSNGTLVTDPEAIDKVALDTFTERLKNRPIREGLEGLRGAKEELCEKRLKMAKMNTTKPWTLSDLDKVLNNLKKGKSRDPYNYANELFHPSVAGYDLRVAILKLVNRIKSEQAFPSALEICNISAIYKNKSSRNDFNNYRGIFRVPILRSIIDRLIYNDEFERIDSAMCDSNVGARKQRNIRDNLFVLGAVINSVIKGNEDSIDIQVFDVDKCFDALWMEECINDLFELGFDNDKLSLLHLENQNARIAVKTNQRISSRTTINNIIMQGTVWGSLCCTASMEKLGKAEYERPELLYKFRNKVSVPSLGMIDDVLKIHKCSMESVNANAFINAFMESKKLTMGKSKCHRLHVSKKKEKSFKCPAIKVHDDAMENSSKEKYLGDIVDESGKVRATIEDRRRKGFSIVSEIMSILDEIPLGVHKMEIGLNLRQAMFLNGILYNSEVWHSITETEIRLLETVDEYLLRYLVNAHSKTPLEFLYLESGVLPIRFIIMSRRILYLQTLLQRDNSELTKKIYQTQKENPLSGDFAELVQNDLSSLSAHLTDSYIESKNKESLKTEIKALIHQKALKYLFNKQRSHSKIKDIKYTKIQPQEYILSPIFTNDEVSILFALRSRMIKVNANFPTGDLNNLCPLCKEAKDDQQHILKCQIIQENYNSEYVSRQISYYEDIFSEDIFKQKEIATLYIELLKIRENIMSQSSPSIPAWMLEDN